MIARLQQFLVANLTVLFQTQLTALTKYPRLALGGMRTMLHFGLAKGYLKEVLFHYISEMGRFEIIEM